MESETIKIPPLPSISDVKPLPILERLPLSDASSQEQELIFTQNRLIRDRLPAHDVAVQECRDAIALLESRIAELQTRKESLKKVLDINFRRLGPRINRLPGEILAPIFEAYLGQSWISKSTEAYDSDSDWDSEEDENYRISADSTNDIGTLSRVCKLWRDVCETTPSLWAILDLSRISASPKELSEALVISLSRAGTVPFSLKCPFRLFRNSASPRDPINDIANVLNTCSTLALTICISDLHHGVPRRMIAPAVRSARLTMEYPPLRDDVPSNFTEKLDLPGLRSLTLNYGALASLLALPPSLLEIRLTQREGYAPPTPIYAPLLPNLLHRTDPIVLTLELRDPSHVVSQARKREVSSWFTFNRLRVLNMVGLTTPNAQGSFMRVFTHAEMPKLEVLSLVQHARGGVFYYLAKQIPPRGSYANSLRSLRAIGFFVKDAKKIFAYLPRLECLEIELVPAESENLAVEFLADLAYQRELPLLLPRLREITLQIASVLFGVNAWSALVDFVFSRSGVIKGSAGPPGEDTTGEETDTGSAQQRHDAHPLQYLCLWLSIADFDAPSSVEALRILDTRLTRRTSISSTPGSFDIGVDRINEYRHFAWVNPECFAGRLFLAEQIQRDISESP